MRIGIDLGGTKTELIALDERGDAVMRFRRPTPAGDSRVTVVLIAEMVLHAEAELGERASVGTPGALSLANGLMKNCNSTCLNGSRCSRISSDCSIARSASATMPTVLRSPRLSMAPARMRRSCSA
jgi:predicted NBD/HSP70 family sugar kinase